MSWYVSSSILILCICYLVPLWHLAQLFVVPRFHVLLSEHSLNFGSGYPWNFRARSVPIPLNEHTLYHVLSFNTLVSRDDGNSIISASIAQNLQP
jgi:hypothetical protein